MEERKEGRKGGRKEGRQEGRKARRQEGRPATVILSDSVEVSGSWPFACPQPVTTALLCCSEMGSCWDLGVYRSINFASFKLPA